MMGEYKFFKLRGLPQDLTTKLMWKHISGKSND